MARPLHLEKYLSAIKENRARLCSGEITHSQQLITIECSIGHKFETQPYRLTRKKLSWCPYCNQRRSVVDLEARERECSKCREWKSFDDFVLDPRKKLGITSSCKTCRNKHSIAFRKANPEKVKSWRASNEETREYYHKNKTHICALRKAARAGQRDSIATRARWARRTDPEYRVLCNSRRFLGSVITQIKKFGAPKNASPLLGCDSYTFKRHVEAQFTEGMSWDNHGRGEGKWQIDHIEPCAAFDLTDDKQRLECFHYSNLRPLWARDNLEQTYKARLTAEARRARKGE